MIDRLRDILYFDFDKAASLISQVEGGLVQSQTTGSEESESEHDIQKYGLLKVFQAEFGGIEFEKRTVLETKILHHDLLIRLEDFLLNQKFALDINSMEAIKDLGQLRNEIAEYAYLKVKGSCVIEDFDRIYDITHHFNDLQDFVQRSFWMNSLGVDALNEKLIAIEEKEGRKSKTYRDVSTLISRSEKQVEVEIKKSHLPDWLFEGLRLWIDVLTKHRLSISLIPFEAHPDLQVIANLKRGCFVDDDIEHLLYGYGSQPNKPLSALGLVTSVPAAEESEGDLDTDNPGPLETGTSEDTEGEVAESHNFKEFESAFRALFPALNELEKFTSYHHYPRIIIHPIAIYRDISKGD